MVVLVVLLLLFDNLGNRYFVSQFGVFNDHSTLISGKIGKIGEVQIS